MELFTPSLYRSFALGFVLGAVALFASIGGDARARLGADFAPAAQAATAQSDSAK